MTAKPLDWLLGTEEECIAADIEFEKQLEEESKIETDKEELAYKLLSQSIPNAKYSVGDLVEYTYDYISDEDAEYWMDSTKVVTTGKIIHIYMSPFDRARPYYKVRYFDKRYYHRIDHLPEQEIKLVFTT